MEKTFQIKWNHGKQGYSYDYFSAKSDYEKAGAECATKALEEQRQSERSNVFFLFKGHAKAQRTVTVSEYDNATNKLVKGGIKFKLKLAFIETSFKGGSKERKEWYVPAN